MQHKYFLFIMVREAASLVLNFRQIFKAVWEGSWETEDYRVLFKLLYKLIFFIYGKAGL